MENKRINLLRKIMKEQGIDLYYLNTTDYHMSEYVPEYFKTIRYFAGFTGSLATLLVSLNDTHIFVDGRYHSQADYQCGKSGIIVEKLGMKDVLEPIDFIKKYYSDSVVGIDGKRTSTLFGKQLTSAGIKVKSIDIYSDLIEDREPLKKDEIYELDIQYTGLSRAKKLQLVKYCMGSKALVVSNLESIAYLLNMRSSDIKYTPVFMSYLVLLNQRFYLFAQEDRLTDDGKMNLLDDGVKLLPYESFYDFITKISDETISLDENKTNFEIYMSLVNRNTIINERSIIEDMKAIKNPIEQKNSKLAHIYDGIAFLKFLMWFDKQDKTKLTEYDVAMKIDEFRLNNRAFDLSFGSIVAYNENSAVIHYSPDKNNAKQLDNSGILLLDTGGQYLCGTTDITRTIALGPVDDRVRKAFTLVLKSMFNLSEMRFIYGVTGNQIDVIARQDLWAQGWDYRHGTGHGVGHILSVHEAPPNIRYMHTDAKAEEVPLENGMIFSDEPGVYFEGSFGIRCENLLLCKATYENNFGRFMKFETLTLVPFDKNLIDESYLDEKTIQALNDYHESVYATLSPYLDDEEKKYLRELTESI